MERTYICQSHLCPWNCSPNSRIPREPSCVEEPGAQGRGEARRNWGGWVQTQMWEGAKTEWDGEKQGEQVKTKKTEVGRGPLRRESGGPSGTEF